MTPHASSPFIPTHKSETFAASVVLAIKLPRYAKDYKLRIDPTSATAWSWGDDSAVVAAGDGFPLASGETLEFSGVVLGTTIYVWQASGSPVDLHHSFLRPAGGVG